MSCSGLYLNWYRPNAPQPTAGQIHLESLARAVCVHKLFLSWTKKNPISINDTKKNYFYETQKLLQFIDKKKKERNCYNYISQQVNYKCKSYIQKQVCSLFIALHSLPNNILLERTSVLHVGTTFSCYLCCRSLLRSDLLMTKSYCKDHQR